MTREQLEIRKYFDGHSTELASIAKNINQFKLHFEELFKKSDMAAEFHELKSKLEDHVKRFEAFETTSKANLSSLIANHADTKQSIKDHVATHEPFEDRFSKLEKAIASIQEEFSKKHTSLSNELTKNLSSFATACGQQFKSLKDEFITSPKAITDSHKDLVNKFEQVSLDCSNAIKRCRNSDWLQQKLEAKLKESEGKSK